MIWFDRKVPRKDADVRIIGRWNAPDSGGDMIEIIMRFNGDERVLWVHNPSGQLSGEPEPDDIHLRYRSKIQKFLQKAQEYPLAQLEGWKKF